MDQSAPSGTSEHSYAYDETGNTVRRTTGERDQTLEWGPEGELVRVTDGLDSTEYVYDADGERLLRRVNGATTLYLPGMEVTWDESAGTEEATRYFQHAGETVAVRENDGSLDWVFSDHHGTGQMTVDAVWGEVVQRRMTVFGQDRGTTGEWPGERGFVNGTVDESTGLTQLGARAYDAALGRFISADPLMDLADSQSMNGYAYANNSPVTYWDGSGLSARDIQQDKARENYLRNTGYYKSKVPKKPSGNSSAVSISINITVYPGGGVRTNWKRMNYGPGISSPRLIFTPSYRDNPGYWHEPVKSPKDEALDAASHQGGDYSPLERAGNWINDNWGRSGRLAVLLELSLYRILRGLCCCWRSSSRRKISIGFLSVGDGGP
ncbi:RHS repeat-associated core domain-containing protein [Nocardiopsis sp. ARC36]